MALSSIHDVGSHGNAVNQKNPNAYIQHGIIDDEKVGIIVLIFFDIFTNIDCIP